MAKVTGVGRGGPDFPEPRTPISGELKRSRDTTVKVVSGVRMPRQQRKFSASKDPVGDTKKEARAARRSMRTWRDY